MIHATTDKDTSPAYLLISPSPLFPPPPPSTHQNLWIDVRTYMDTAPYSLNESSSIQRCYRLFRSMGLRHLIVLDDQHRVTGMVTRRDITEHRLMHEWTSNVSCLFLGPVVLELRGGF